MMRWLWKDAVTAWLGSKGDEELDGDNTAAANPQVQALGAGT